MKGSGRHRVAGFDFDDIANDQLRGGQLAQAAVAANA
jgi:hypothetical protein